MTDARTTSTNSRDGLACLLLVGFTAVASLLVQWRALVNSDVAFLTWTASQVAGPPVFGVDIYEVNPPLAFLIYAPAAFVAPWIGAALAVKLWVMLLACLSLAMFWHSCDARLRLPLSITLSLFFCFALPGVFGQREQIALMLTAPYVAGPCRDRRCAILSGVMAGVGFAIKPYFLIPLVLVFATRRRIGREEIAIALTGAIYAASLILFFQPYLFSFLPLARATYWATHMGAEITWKVSAVLMLLAVSLSVAGAPQPEARGFAAAAIGFTLAALIQFKGFAYQFFPAWGYLLLFLVARAFNARRLVAVCAVIGAAVVIWTLGKFSLDFRKPDPSQQMMARLLPEIDGSKSYLSFALAPFPAFPTALYTQSRYDGRAIWPIFISAAREPSASPELQEKARRLTLDQAIQELQRNPELVIVERPPLADGWGRPRFDLLSWYKTDPGFRAEWSNYAFDKTLEGFDLYRRR